MPLDPWSLLLGGWSPCLENNSKMLSFGEKTDLAGEGLVCTGPSNPPFTIFGGTQLAPFSDTAKNTLGEDSFCEPKQCSGNQHQPQYIFAQESNACLVLP